MSCNMSRLPHAAAGPIVGLRDARKQPDRTTVKSYSVYPFLLHGPRVPHAALRHSVDGSTAVQPHGHGESERQGEARVPTQSKHGHMHGHGHPPSSLGPSSATTHRRPQTLPPVALCSSSFKSLSSIYESRLAPRSPLPVSLLHSSRTFVSFRTASAPGCTPRALPCRSSWPPAPWARIESPSSLQSTGNSGATIPW